MKELTVILMTLVMVFTVSCSKGSGNGSNDKKDSTAKADEKVVADLKKCASNIKLLAENEDNQALFDETVALYITLEPIMANPSKDLEKISKEILDPLEKNEITKKIGEKIAMAAHPEVSSPASDSGDIEDPEAPTDAPVEMEGAEMMEVAEPNF